MKQSLDGISAIALLGIASFAIDRVVAGLLFLLTYANPSYDPALVEVPSARVTSEKRLKLIYVIVAGVLAGLALILYPKLRILYALGIPANESLDSLLTGLVLVGGSEQLAGLLKTTGMPEVKKSEPQPIQINGRLILEQPEHTVQHVKAA